jgi:AcrR family transcriptional regulator
MSDDEILAATSRAISRTGPRDLTLAAVASEAGLVPATLVQRFGSKRGLLLAFSSLAVESVPESFSAARRRHASPMAALRAALLGMTTGVSSPSELSNHVAFLALELADPDFHTETLRHATALRTQIRGQLDDAVTAGELPKCNTRRLAERVYVTYNGVLISWAILRQGSLPSLMRRHLNAVLAEASC